MTWLYCADCGDRFEPDDDHTWVTGERKRIDDRNETDEFAFCPECWRELIADWNEPV